MNEATAKQPRKGHKLFSSQPGGMTSNVHNTMQPSRENKVVRGRPSSDKRNNYNGKKKMKRWKKVLIIIGIVLAAIVLLVIGFLTYMFSELKSVEKLDASKLGINDEIASKYADADIVNIALFGVDARENDTKFRSDTMMIASIDKKNNQIKITSILRDSYVPIEGHGQDKITHAYYYGGPELAIKTINQNYGMDIVDYATVDFNGLVEIIDYMGGIEIEITEAERKETNKILRNDGKVNVPQIEKSGLVSLDGEQATTYARIRKGNTGDDNARAVRQQRVLNCLLGKVKEVDKLKYPGLVKEMLSIVETTLTQGDILSFSTMAVGDMPPVIQNSIPDVELDRPTGGNYNGQWVWRYDLNAAKDRLHKFIYEDEVVEPTSEPAGE